MQIFKTSESIAVGGFACRCSFSPLCLCTDILAHGLYNLFLRLYISDHITELFENVNVKHLLASFFTLRF